MIDDHRRLFGRGEVKDWRPAIGFFDVAERAAARHQDAVCRRMRDAMRAVGLSGEDLSARLGKNRAHVGRKLRGEDWLSWREVHEWVAATGDTTLLTVAEELDFDDVAEVDLP